MDALKKLKAAAEELAERLDLPGEALAGSAKLTVTSDRRALIENHRGIMEYSPERIAVNLARGRIIVSGTGLGIGAMNKSELYITGKIQNVEWE